ncbi:hypothetical protein Mapa_012644 [Marchantia paleacea]|nr:hypothetical protein Mapa_012644 [Marchantia paleacea]
MAGLAGLVRGGTETGHTKRTGRISGLKDNASPTPFFCAAPTPNSTWPPPCWQQSDAVWDESFSREKPLACGWREAEDAMPRDSAARSRGDAAAVKRSVCSCV